MLRQFDIVHREGRVEDGDKKKAQREAQTGY
jgi:hypothetical protein